MCYGPAVTKEPYGDRQPGPQGGGVWTPPLGVSTPSPAPHSCGLADSPIQLARAGHATGVRNLGPEPHKARAAFIARLCCQLPMTRLLKRPYSPHIPFDGLMLYPGPTGSAHHLAWGLTAPAPPLSQPPLPRGYGAAGLHLEPQFPTWTVRAITVPGAKGGPVVFSAQRPLKMGRLRQEQH